MSELTQNITNNEPISKPINKYYLFVCKYLLMGPLFKKYWIFGGSVWNRLFGKLQTNSKSKYDLELIISNANYYEAIHSGIIIGTAICGSLQKYCIKNDNNKNKWLMSSIILINYYVILMQEYNKTMAHQKIRQLKLTNIEPNIEPNIETDIETDIEPNIEPNIETDIEPNIESNIEPNKYIQKEFYPEGIAIRKQWNDTYCWYIIKYGSVGLDIGHQYNDLVLAETALIEFDKFIDKFRDIKIDDNANYNAQLYSRANYIGRIKEYLSESDYTDCKTLLNW